MKGKSHLLDLSVESMFRLDWNRYLC
jgi:hypothetical protein